MLGLAATLLLLKPDGVFHLGRIEVRVTAEAAAVSTAPTVDQEELRARNIRSLPDALSLVPGVSIQKIGPRNERGVQIRGFDMRQAPLYIDGIPVYVPYDGYVDMDRFLTFDFSEIQVSKGFTSPLYGPNAIGGAVNLVTKAPAKPLDLDTGGGYGSGSEAQGFVNAGGRWRNWWGQGNFASLSRDTFPLSGQFRPVPLQATGDRLNSYQTDYKARARIGWTPDSSSQYTFTYSVQRGEKGNPVYAGQDPVVRPRFWQWPQWDKESFYFIGDKSFSRVYVKSRLYYDRFDNLLKSYDDARYATQTRPSSFTSPYDDDTYGGTVELGSRSWERHTLKGAFYFKDDTHREGNVGEPIRSFRDRSTSIGVEDTVRLGWGFHAVGGFSADRLTVLNAENFAAGAVTPFARNTIWAFNPQAGLFRGVGQSGRLRFTFARKTRLPTIKDRYSYRLGQAIPNPDLREERSNHWEAGYSQLLGRRSFVEASLFRSDVSNSTQRFFVQPNVFQLRNLGEARHLGAEIGLRSQVLQWVQTTANYTYLSRRNQSNPALLLFDAPRHRVYASAVVSRGRWSVLTDIQYEGGRYWQNEAGSVGRATRFATVGLGGTVRLGSGWTFQAGAANLFDRNYLLVDGYPEAGRTMYVNVRWRM